MGSFSFGQFGQEVMIVLRNFSILSSNKAVEFTKTFESLFQGTLLVLGSSTILPVNVLDFVQVKLGKSFSPLVNSFPFGLVPSVPRA